MFKLLPVHGIILIKIFIVVILATNSTGRSISRKLEIEDQTLDLSNKQLTDNDLPQIFKQINGLVGVKRLDLSKNNFTSFSINVSLNLLRNLGITDFILDDNNISEVPDNLYRFFPYLELLSLKDNNITKVRNQFFGLDRLKKLYLDKNPIDRISRHAFSGLKNLEKLSLNNTNLTSGDISSVLISPNVTIIFEDQYKFTTVSSLPIFTNDITSTVIMTTPEATTTTPEATTKTKNMSKSSSAYNFVSLWTTIFLIISHLILL